jgi:NADH:ubiquinone oxidoreductase subunit 3 (subunit A)
MGEEWKEERTKRYESGEVESERKGEMRVKETYYCFLHFFYV